MSVSDSASGSGLVQVGAHCSLSVCNLNDFLPIRCKCDKLFCRDHIIPEAHDCPILVQQPKATGSSPKLQRCAASSCNKPSLEAYIANAEVATQRSPALCPGCRHAFCAEHREPKAHSCSPLQSPREPTQKNATAKALLSKHFGSTISNVSVNASRPALSSNPKKLAQQQQVAAMKMRHKAKPADPKDTPASVPVDQRLHIKVRRVEDDPISEQILWFRKSTWTGRALDMLGSLFKMTISDTEPLKLLYVTDDEATVVLSNDKALANQIPDGASLVLSR
ncbi:hypothetical protein C8Q79DRAFT_954309 [Trametes meyenii]|nr:hypothetical protein C8Q79DRAFT_954309 [Trametes meyenii]